MTTKGIIGLIFLGLLIILLFQNQQIITYRVFFWDVNISQVLLVPVLLLVGFFFGLAVRKRKKTGLRGPREREEAEEFEEID